MPHTCKLHRGSPRAILGNPFTFKSVNPQLNFCGGKSKNYESNQMTISGELPIGLVTRALNFGAISNYFLKVVMEDPIICQYFPFALKQYNCLLGIPFPTFTENIKSQGKMLNLNKQFN